MKHSVVFFFVFVEGYEDAVETHIHGLVFFVRGRTVCKRVESGGWRFGCWSNLGGK